MLRNRLNADYCRQTDIVGSGCNTGTGLRGSVCLRSVLSTRPMGFRPGKRTLRMEVPVEVLEQSSGTARTHAADCPAANALPAATSLRQRLQRRGELPSPIWASLVLGRV